MSLAPIQFPLGRHLHLRTQQHLVFVHIVILAGTATQGCLWDVSGEQARSYNPNYACKQGSIEEPFVVNCI